MRKNYASRLTKDMLIRSGVEYITDTGTVFRDGKQVKLSVNASGYLTFTLPEVDDNGNYIKMPITRKMKGCKNPVNTYTLKYYTVGLHRAMWAWYNHEVPEGYVVDHINNSHDKIEDYTLDNLQLLTPAENLLKEHGESTRKIKCSLSRPLEYYTDKLNDYLIQYDEAKKDCNAALVHHLRANISNTRARIRYYLGNKDEANNILSKNNNKLEEKLHKKSVRELKAKAKELAKFSKARGDYKTWHSVLKFINNYKDTPENYQTLQVLEACWLQEKRRGE